MISSTSPVAPAIPVETSILGIQSPSDSISSFADLLASAVNQAGTNAGTPSQNSDTQPLSVGSLVSPAPAGPSAPGSPAVQYSFFQYLIDTPPTTDTTAGINTASASTPAAAGIQQSSVQNASSTADPGWLSPPYYTPPAPVFVSWEDPPGVVNTTASPETDLQNLAAQLINDPLQFDWGSAPATTPQGLVDNFVNYAQSRATTYPEASPDGYDPVAMGTKYANLVLDSLKKIQYDTVGSSPFASVYDAWVAGVNTWPGASGTASAAS